MIFDSETTVQDAQSGDRSALEVLIRHAQPIVARLAARMLGSPEAAEDATQDVLIRIITKLSTFDGQSRFETWVYRVAMNALLNAKRDTARDLEMTFETFAEDLLEGLADDHARAPEDHVMLNELRVRCTMAMLLCLDREHRAAYVLGEILELSHGDAAGILDVSTANYRQRLSRARAKVHEFTASSCGLVSDEASCSCRKRLPQAMRAKRVPEAPSPELGNAPSMREALHLAHTTESALRTAVLQRATGPLNSARDHARDVLSIVDPPQ